MCGSEFTGLAWRVLQEVIACGGSSCLGDFEPSCIFGCHAYRGRDNANCMLAAFHYEVGVQWV